MASPFPGMDPYLEDPAFWRDFHHEFIGCWRKAVADQLPDSYDARLDVTMHPIRHGFLDRERQGQIKILHRPDQKLVAVLELLSPTNKNSAGIEEYRAKRRAVLHQRVHLVELDLLLAGTRPSHLDPLPAGDYFAFISRTAERPKCEVYPWTVREPLPTIPIPLQAPDRDIHVDLAEVFAATYERGRYRRALAYGKKPVAPLDSKDAKWAMAVSGKST